MKKSELRKLIREVIHNYLKEDDEPCPDQGGATNACNSDSDCTHGETGEIVGDCIDGCCVTYNKPTYDWSSGDDGITPDFDGPDVPSWQKFPRLN